MNKFNNFYIIITLIFLSCEPDDICLQSFEDTPKIIVRFYDEKTSELKPIKNIRITSVKSQDTLNFKETDSIAFPLNHNDNYSLFNINIESSQVDNSDNVLINYEKKPVYISVGCGYILNFKINSLLIEKDSDNWIKNYNIYKSNIENEETKHVEIFH